LVAQCLAFDPACRYARARDLAEDLRRFLEDRPMKHCPEPSVRERLGKFARRHPGLCGSTSIALLSLLLIGALVRARVRGYEATQDLAARVHRRVFEREFTEAQFLLHTADASDDHLRKGMARAAASLRDLGPGDGTVWPSAGWVRRLTPEEG